MEPQGMEIQKMVNSHNLTRLGCVICQVGKIASRTENTLLAVGFSAFAQDPVGTPMIFFMF